MVACIIGRSKGLVAALILILLPWYGWAVTLRVAVAANFKPQLQQLKSDFEQQKGIGLQLSSASTGVLFAQITQGAPFDLFLAADEQRPMLLEQQQQILIGTRHTYAIGRLALWHREQKPDLLLLQNWTGKLAMANPKTAPYGMAAKYTLDKLGLWASKRTQIIMGANVAQTYQFIQSGNVELGFVALSQLLDQSIHKANYWIMPSAWYPPIRQQLVVLSRSQFPQQAKVLVQWLLSKPIQQKIVDSGYASDVASN